MDFPAFELGRDLERGGSSDARAIGDITADVEAGKRAGTRTVLVGPEPSIMPPDFRAAGFSEVVGYILREGGVEERTESTAGVGL